MLVVPELLLVLSVLLYWKCMETFLGSCQFSHVSIIIIIIIIISYFFNCKSIQ
jgi:hypothetical protein